jgi:hypothetical protein
MPTMAIGSFIKASRTRSRPLRLRRGRRKKCADQLLSLDADLGLGRWRCGPRRRRRRVAVRKRQRDQEPETRWVDERGRQGSAQSDAPRFAMPPADGIGEQ